MKTYDPTLKPEDPKIALHIPVDILRDLVLRSQENGNDIGLEISTRLARTLERDLDMIEQDNEWAYAAFKVVSGENTI